MTATWLSVSLMATISALACGQSQPQDRFALTAGQVARALSDKGMPTTDAEVSLLTRVVATETSPALDVLSVELLSRQSPAEHSPARSRVKLGCHLPGKCLPFYAVVIWSEPPAGLTATTRRASAGVNDPVSKEIMDITMRAGTHATLVMDDNRSHIQVAVISLENGLVGHRIHVASPDHKQTYVGEVVNARLLRGSF
jgi:hypothetical protein